MDEPRTQTLDTELAGGGSAPLTLQPHLALVLEASAPGARGARFALMGASEVHLGRGATRSAIRSADGATKRIAISVAAPAMSSRHARLVREGQSWFAEDLGSRNGTWVNGERIARAPLKDGDLVQLGDVFFSLRLRWPSAATETHLDHHGEAAARGLATLHPALGASHRALGLIARSRVSVLVLGETGCGKELTARAIHDLSGRSGEFVAINCGALPESLVEGLLFGHMKGAFSGAQRDQIGLVRAADRGTLFLDEIGDLPPASQAVLLRVLQESEVTPIGGTRPQSLDLRVVAATHRPIEALAKDGAFRSDLLARLRGYVHVLPPLSERREDLGILVADLLERIDGGTEIIGFEPRAARALLRYDWPLNIRELEQCLSAAVALARGGRIALEHLPAEVAAALDNTFCGDKGENEQSTRARLVRELDAARGNVAAVARAMGKAPMQVRRWMKRWNIEPEAFRDEA